MYLGKKFQRAEVCLTLCTPPPNTQTWFRVSLVQILVPKKEGVISGDSGLLSRYLKCQHYNCYSAHKIGGEPRWGFCDHSDFKELDISCAVNVRVCTLLWKDSGEQARQSLSSRDPGVQKEDKMTGTISASCDMEMNRVLEEVTNRDEEIQGSWWNVNQGWVARLWG